MSKKAFVIVFAALLIGLCFAGEATTRLKEALLQFCSEIKGMVPVAAMLMILLASVIYSLGQLMGAETRARANVWATSCLTGALIGILISVVAPAILQQIAGPGVGAINC